MKGILTLKILEILEKTAWTISDLSIIATAPYGSSYSQFERLARERRRHRKSVVEDYKEYKRFYNFIYTLRKQGLVENVQKNRKRSLKITIKGKQKIEVLRLRKTRSMPKKDYSKVKSSSMKIVIFDIPEKERFKRNWLRTVLRNLDFKMLQKSVWAGNVKLPIEFIQDMKRFKLLSYVEIFSVTRTGSLK